MNPKIESGLQSGLSPVFSPEVSPEEVRFFVPPERGAKPDSGVTCPASSPDSGLTGPFGVTQSQPIARDPGQLAGTPNLTPQSCGADADGSFGYVGAGVPGWQNHGYTDAPYESPLTVVDEPALPGPEVHQAARKAAGEHQVAVADMLLHGSALEPVHLGEFGGSVPQTAIDHAGRPLTYWGGLATPHATGQDGEAWEPPTIPPTHFRWPLWVLIALAAVVLFAGDWLLSLGGAK